MTYCTARPHQMDPLTVAELEDADLMLFGNPELPAFEDCDEFDDLPINEHRAH